MAEGQMAWAKELQEKARSLRKTAGEKLPVDPGSFTAVSIKRSAADYYGDPRQVMAWQGICHGSVSPDIREYILYTESLRKLALVGEHRWNEAFAGELARSVYAGNTCDLPAWSSLLHAVIDAPVVITASTLGASAAALTAGTGSEKAPEIGRYLPFQVTGSALNLAVADAVSEQENDSAGVILLEGYGFLIHAPAVQAAEAKLDEISNELADLLQNAEFPSLGAPLFDKFEQEETARIRRILSENIGKPVLLRTYTLEEDQKLLDVLKASSRGSIFHALDEVFPDGVYSMEEILDPGSSAAGELSKRTCKLPILIRGKKNVLHAAASTPAGLTRADEVLDHALQLQYLADDFGIGLPVSLEASGEAAAAVQPVHSQPAGVFAGEVALVSGAASGIGKGCVESLLERGACVIGLDINPDILDVVDSPGYLGIECDLTDENAVRSAFDQIVVSFGGLDMMVLNAGVFPPSKMVSEMDMELWRKVMSVNLDSNLHLLKCAYPLLKQAPDHGRVVFNASRNVPAPGPGAAAYSSSKAAFTQLARVTAMEWGKDHIPVNIIHPHAVFDTGIWTKEVLESRAAKYGITVEEYKTNNVLGVELSSRDVGEIVAEICGPRFAKITGAQIPVDGGSNRVI